jgi:hypothetical protein
METFLGTRLPRIKKKVEKVDIWISILTHPIFNKGILNHSRSKIRLGDWE